MAPFESQAQNAYMHAHPEILGNKLKEWEHATNYSNLPKKKAPKKTKPEPKK